LLCPNCNSQQPTFGGRNIRNALGLPASEPKKPRLRRIPPPRPHKRKAQRPPEADLLREVEEIGFRAVGRRYGVSDTAIRKWLKVYAKHGS
jgi:hypothetical protein